MSCRRAGQFLQRRLVHLQYAQFRYPHQFAQLSAVRFTDQHLVGHLRSWYREKEGPVYYSWYTANSDMPDDNVFIPVLKENGIVWAGTKEQSGVVRFDENLWMTQAGGRTFLP